MLRGHGLAAFQQVIEQAFVDAPVPAVVGVAQCAARHAGQSQVIPFAALRHKAGDDVSQAVMPLALGV